MLAAAVAFAVAVRRRFLSGSDQTYWIQLGSASGIVAIAVQSLVEFSLQMRGNAALFATLCALALHRDERPPALRRPPDTRREPPARSASARRFIFNQTRLTSQTA